MTKISCMMNVYNGEKHVKEAVDSILNQTFTDFEIVIIDDGSTDRTLQILESYDDPRIRIFKNGRNLGISESRNRGLKKVRGKYVAPLDADDISLPHRFETLYRFMEENPQIDVCGSATEVFGAASRITKPLLTHEEIFAGFLHQCRVLYSSAIMRREKIVSLDDPFDTGYTFCGDYDLFVRLALMGCKLANLNKVLVKYRVHDTNVSVVYNETQRQFDAKVRLHLFKELNIENPEEKLPLHQLLKSGKRRDRHEMEIVSGWIDELVAANEKRGLFHHEILKKELARMWYMALTNSCHNGLWAWRRYQRQPVSRYYPLGPASRITLWGKCLLRVNAKKDLVDGLISGIWFELHYKPFVLSLKKRITRMFSKQSGPATVRNRKTP